MKSSELIEKQFIGRTSALIPFLCDAEVTDILINGTQTVFVEKRGGLQCVSNPFANAENLFELIERMVLPIGKRIDAELARWDKIVKPLRITSE